MNTTVNAPVNTIRIHNSRQAARNCAKQVEGLQVLDLNSTAAKKHFSVAQLSVASKQGIRWATVPVTCPRPTKPVQQMLFKYSNRINNYLVEANRVTAVSRLIAVA